MRYSLFDSLDIERAKLLYKAEKRFDCKNLKYLEKFQLSDKYKLGDIKPETPNVFVTASNMKYYYSVRAVIAGIQRTFAKDGVKEGSPPKIIFYDLGGITADRKKRKELKSVCNLEYRIFDWTQLPNDVHGLKTFSWKVIILAEMFQEFNSFMYLDTSINFLEKAQMSPQFAWKEPNWQPYDRFEIYTRMYREGLISSVSFTHATEHGIRYATHPDMYLYIAVDPVFDVAHDLEMYEANFIIFHKSEMARQLLKWSVLCAVTRDCIDPPGANFDGCDNTNAREDIPGSCNRLDQSVMTILINNLEMTMFREGSKILVHRSPYNHPIRYYRAHTVERGQTTSREMLSCE
ncbi:hypothetical protein Ddc_10791 [Ditylenchus destructor]|nr:hypothetical protein Ddc_10791 [Ditylenchus destructor]